MGTKKDTCFLVILSKIIRSGEGGGLPCPFSKLKKKCPGFGKKHQGNFHVWVKFLSEDAVLSVSRRKISEIFPAGRFFWMLQIKFSSKCPYFIKPPLPWKIPGYAPDNCVVLIILRISFWNVVNTLRNSAFFPVKIFLLFTWFLMSFC